MISVVASEQEGCGFSSAPGPFFVVSVSSLSPKYALRYYIIRTLLLYIVLWAVYDQWGHSIGRLAWRQLSCPLNGRSVIPCHPYPHLLQPTCWSILRQDTESTDAFPLEDESVWMVKVTVWADGLCEEASASSVWRMGWMWLVFVKFKDYNYFKNED